MLITLACFHEIFAKHKPNFLDKKETEETRLLTSHYITFSKHWAMVSIVMVFDWQAIVTFSAERED